MIREDINDKKSCLNVIEQYFKGYYETLKTGQYVNTSSLFLINDDTVIPQRTLQNKMKLYKAFNLEIKEYNLDLEYVDTTINDYEANIILIENADYRYNKAPSDLVSKISNIEYTVKLKKIRGQWKIAYMDSTDEDYIMAKERSRQSFQEMTASGRYVFLAEKGRQLHLFFNELDNKINRLKAFSEKVQQANIPFLKDPQLSRQVADFSYIRENGIKYARDYANFSQIPNDRKLFYYAKENDCTNFVSQCIWAAYGGYLSEDFDLTKKNVQNRVRMVSAGEQDFSWYGTGVGGGGTISWENVARFYHYTTQNKAIGPRGISYGAGRQADFNFYNVAPGHILQFWPTGKSRWHHTVYVTTVNTPGMINEMFVCQHSKDVKERPLIELLNWNTNEGQIRGIYFDSALFNK